jgi:hypothetical protein
VGRQSRRAGRARLALRIDSRDWLRETDRVIRPGASRQRLACTLNTAYAHGLLSQKTLVHRLDLLFGTYVNEVSGGRCELRPGDQVVLGGECLMID